MLVYSYCLDKEILMMCVSLALRQIVPWSKLVNYCSYRLKIIANYLLYQCFVTFLYPTLSKLFHPPPVYATCAFNCYLAKVAVHYKS